MNKVNKVQQLIGQALVDNFKNTRKGKGIDWSQKNMYDGIGRPDLKPKHIDGLSGREEFLALKEINKDPDLCPSCQSMTHLEVEVREGGYSEHVRYCEYCGATQTS